jgi:hypothetical protein
VQVDADSHEQLHGTEREVKRAGERAELLRRQMKFGLQRCCQYGRDGPEGLAHRERGRQRQQYDPGPGMPVLRILGGHHRRERNRIAIV